MVIYHSNIKITTITFSWTTGPNDLMRKVPTEDHLHFKRRTGMLYYVNSYTSSYNFQEGPHIPFELAFFLNNPLNQPILTNVEGMAKL